MRALAHPRRTAAHLAVVGVSALILSSCSSSADPAATSTTSAVNASAAAIRSSTAATSAAGTTSTPAASTSAGSGSSTLDVCSLLTSAQATSINHVTYGAATPQHIRAGFDTCDYANGGHAASPIDVQDLTVQVISIAGCYPQLQDAEGPGKAVTGVGDGAFGYEIGMVTKAGDRCVEVSGLTAAEFRDDYGPDSAMTKIIISNLH